jgi:hypothetical protein
VEGSLSVDGYIKGWDYHFIVWFKGNAIIYKVVQVAPYALEDWWKENRPLFSKLLQIVTGGVQNLPDEMVTRLNKLLEKGPEQGGVMI